MLLQWMLCGVLVTHCLGLPQDVRTSKYPPAPPAGDDITLESPIDDIIRGLIEDFRANMSEGFPQWGLPPLDPLHIDNIPIAIDESAISLNANILNADVADLSQFEIAALHTNILKLELQVALNLSDVKLSCHYYIDGVIASLFPLYGAGPCSVVLSDVTLGVDADLKYNRSDGDSHIQIDTMDFDLGVKGLEIEMHNLFNSEDLAEVIDGFANDFGPLLIDVLVNDTRRDLLPTIIVELNKLLWNASLPFMDEQPTVLSDNREMLLSRLTSSANADAFFDRLMPYLQDYITASNLDPFPLPEISAEVMGNTGVKLYDGSLAGLSSVARSGGSQMAYDESEWLSVGSGVGFQQLAGGYKLKVEVFGIGPHVSAEVQLDGTRAEFDAQISSQSLAIKLNKLRIADIGNVHVKIHGLGIVFEFLVSPLISLVASLFKGQIADAISGALFDALDGVLSKIDLLDILENL